MPFDPINYAPQTETKIATKAEFDAAAPRQRCLMLADLLDSARLPLRWDFENIEIESDCGTAGCAIGTARAQWPGPRWNDLHVMNVGRKASQAFGMSEEAAASIFGEPLSGFRRLYGVTAHGSVTPAMVAAELRKHGARQP